MSIYYFEIKFATPEEEIIEESGFYCAKTLRCATNDLYNFYGVEQDEENELIQFSITPFEDGPIIMPAAVCETYMTNGDWNKILRPAGCMDAGKVGY